MMKHIRALMQIPPVFTDGFLCIIAAGCTASLTYVSQEEAYKYINPTMLYYLKWILGVSGTMISALAGFRSKVYGQHLQQVKADATGVAQVTTVQPEIIKTT